MQNDCDLQTPNRTSTPEKDKDLPQFTVGQRQRYKEACAYAEAARTEERLDALKNKSERRGPAAAAPVTVCFLPFPATADVLYGLFRQLIGLLLSFLT
jgi:hypothetical protein